MKVILTEEEVKAAIKKEVSGKVIGATAADVKILSEVKEAEIEV